MSAPNMIFAYICFAIACGLVVFGIVLSTELISLYGETVSPVMLVGQAAILWLPIACVMFVLGVFLSRRS